MRQRLQSSDWFPVCQWTEWVLRRWRRDNDPSDSVMVHSNKLDLQTGHRCFQDPGDPCDLLFSR